ncbi:MAG: hypothetical protein J4F35_09115 [Candidatus Latescibacteria bacterium]|nr:hypothetical protein [Candidatus Latescibacterota bacterium]
MAGLVIALALSLGGCVPFIGGPDQRRQLARAAQDLVEIIEVREGEVDWLGLRDPAGVQTEETKVLDDYVLSALMRTEVAVGLVDTTGKRWRGEELVGLKQGGSAALALGGRLEADAPWMYVRMFLVERKSGELVATRTTRISEQDVRHEVASRQLGTGESYGPIEVELHLIAKREEGGVAQAVELAEGVQLQQGDQLQLRFKLSRDAEVHAFLCSSTGARETLFDEQFVYSDIVQYAPGENDWIAFNELDQVYTLYFLAGPQLLAENAGPFYEQFATLVRDGQINRFAGLDQLDTALVEFLQRPEPLEVLRGDEDISLGQPETMVYDDGNTLSSQAEILTGTPVLVRALSFSVQ